MIIKVFLSPVSNKLYKKLDGGYRFGLFGVAVIVAKDNIRENVDTFSKVK